MKVISVGNITLGGSGKTPTVIALAKWLKKKGKKVAVLSRGYGRQGSGLVIVSNEEKILVTPEQAGDEPYLLAQKLEGIPVIVGRDRYKAGFLAKEKFNSEVVILDDGFQHWCLKRDLDIVCLDSLTSLKNEPLFPLGTLREPISALKRVNLILLTNVNLITSEELEEWYDYLKRICPRVPIVESISRPLVLHLLADNSEILETSFLQSKEVVLLSSLANPYAFEKTIEKLGARIVRKYNFSDHHWYEEKDLLPLREREYPVVSTEKDEVKLKQITNHLPRCISGTGKLPHARNRSTMAEIANKIYVLEIKLEIVRGENIWEEKIKQVFG